jgi:hypothetical protein
LESFSESLGIGWLFLLDVFGVVGAKGGAISALKLSGPFLFLLFLAGQLLFPLFPLIDSSFPWQIASLT